MPTPETITLGGIMPQFTPMTPAELAEFSQLTSDLFAGKAKLVDVKPTLLEKAVLEIRAWRRMHP